MQSSVKPACKGSTQHIQQHKQVIKSVKSPHNVKSVATWKSTGWWRGLLLQQASPTSGTRWTSQNQCASHGSSAQRVRTGTKELHTGCGMTSPQPDSYTAVQDMQPHSIFDSTSTRVLAEHLFHSSPAVFAAPPEPLLAAGSASTRHSCLASLLVQVRGGQHGGHPAVLPAAHLPPHDDLAVDPRAAAGDQHLLHALAHHHLQGHAVRHLAEGRSGTSYKCKWPPLQHAWHGMA